MINCNTFLKHSSSETSRLCQVTALLTMLSVGIGQSALAETVRLSQSASETTKVASQLFQATQPKLQSAQIQPTATPSSLQLEQSPYQVAQLSFPVATSPTRASNSASVPPPIYPIYPVYPTGAGAPMIPVPMPAYPMYPGMPGMMPVGYPSYPGSNLAQLRVPSTPPASLNSGQTPPPPSYPAYPTYPAGTIAPGMPMQAYPVYPALPGMMPGSYPGFPGGIPMGAYPVYPPGAMVPMMPVPGYPGYPAMPGMMPGTYPGFPNGMPAATYPMYPAGMMPAMPQTAPGVMATPTPGRPPLAPVYPNPGVPAAPMIAAPVAPPVAPLPPLPTATPVLGQPASIPAGAPLPAPRETASFTPGKAITPPFLGLQGAAIYQGDEFSARARVYGRYFLSPNILFGSTIDLTTGNAFADTNSEGLNINELYVAANLPNVPNLRFVIGQMDLTSYFDRNSFAKDVTTQFFNTVFQTNPALAQANIGSRPGALVNWRVTDNVEAKAAVFSSSASLSDFNLNAFAGEVDVRVGNFIVRGTYASGRNAENGGFPQIFQRNPGPSSNDRIEAYGFNAEYFIPEIRLGIFARYGWYNNLTLNASANTYSFGINALDLFLPNDRLGIGYGQQLSSRSGSDVFEAFYDLPVYQNIRLGFSFQGLNGFSETILGVRVKADLDITPRTRTQ